MSEARTMSQQCQSEQTNANDNLERAKKQLEQTDSRLNKKTQELGEQERDHPALEQAEKDANDLFANYQSEYQDHLKAMQEVQSSLEAAGAVLEEVMGLLKATQLHATTDTEKGNYQTVLDMLVKEAEQVTGHKLECNAELNRMTSAYPDNLAALTKQKADSEAALNQATATMASLRLHLSELATDLESYKAQVDAATKTVQKWNEACSPLSLSHEDLQQSREDEIAALRRAKEILSATDNSFIQKAAANNHFLASQK